MAEGFIVNSPYTEPEYHHVYNPDTCGFDVVSGRRKAGYFIADDLSGEMSRFVELPLVNRIRALVKDWREGGYAHVTGTTRRLLEHWHDISARKDKPFFWCQLEAIETLVFLAEVRGDDEIPNDGGEIRRLCTKLCTGGGKTIVMSMLIAWLACNKSAYPRDNRFTRNFLVVAPNLTVRSRLEVLKPGNEENYYDSFGVVPEGMRQSLNQARVEIVNWQRMIPEKPDTNSVDKRGPKSDGAFCREIVGDMKNLVVINDEAHHAWRVKPGDNKTGTKSEREEATVWIQGLDRINRTRGILACYDFSATPFEPGRTINDAGGLFTWIVSDYSLSDGVEAGIVKTPRHVVRDSAAPDSRTYRSKLFHIYADPEVKNQFSRAKQEESAPLPDLVKTAYMLLGRDWKSTFDSWREMNAPTPPVMITVANNTDTAARIAYAFEHGNIGVPELCDVAGILHIDSKVLEKPEGEEIRRMADTVGKEGRPGEGKYNVISVGMLSEGWDTRTVTHIIGLRAFTSQLLCEQVVGRGLRRTSYDPPEEEGGLFAPEYVNVFGVPFNFLLFGADEDVRRVNEPHIEKPKYPVRPLKERREYMISWPEVERLEYVMSQKLSLNVGEVPELVLSAESTRISAELAPVLDGKTDLTKCLQVELESLYREIRLQRIIFDAAGKVYGRFSEEWQKEGPKLSQIGQVIALTVKYLRNVRITPELFATDKVRRMIVLAMNMERIISHIWRHITSDNVERILPVLPQGKRERSTEEMREWWTARANFPAKKSQINRCVFDSTWESAAAYALDGNPDVKAWVKNDHLGFHVNYMYGGTVRRYLPDFLVKLRNGKMLILEVKGQEGEQDMVKRQALEDWVKAVNGVKVFGEWVSDVSRSPGDVDGIIAKHE